MEIFEKLVNQYELILIELKVFGDHFLLFSCVKVLELTGKPRNDDRFVLNLLTDELISLPIDYVVESNLEFCVSLDSSKYASKSLLKN